MSQSITIDIRATELTRRRYQRLSFFYDAMETLAERRYHPWREQLWSRIRSGSVLEIGVGTGKNMPYYPKNVRMAAIDLTPGMLARAQKRAAELKLDVDLRLGDVQALGFPEASFENVVATFVFCSVPDAVLGLLEVRRVLKPGGRLYLLEHMRASNPNLGLVMDALNPLVVRMTGANINRRTVNNVYTAGFGRVEVTDLAVGGIFKQIIAQNI